MAHKWTHYFPVYEAHLARYKNRPAVFIEIGVGAGGSLQLWKSYLGPFAQIVGLDLIDKSDLEEEQISIRTGHQSDPEFLQSVIDEFGTPDVVLDDGSHIMDDVGRTFAFLYPRISPVGAYMIEDLHTAYWPEYGGGFGEPQSFIETAKGLIDELNADHSSGRPRTRPSSQHPRYSMPLLRLNDCLRARSPSSQACAPVGRVPDLVPQRRWSRVRSAGR